MVEIEDRCPWPYCSKDAYHDGDHSPREKTEQPSGQLRVIQKFQKTVATPFCELHPGKLAAVLVTNEHGHAWTLCPECEEEYL